MCGVFLKIFVPPQSGGMEIRMKYFIDEGTILNADKMSHNIMKTHMEYTQKAMDEGMILLSGLKET